NINKHNINALQEIIQHEATHVNQNHYIDIVLSEILCAVNWINPFVWMLRNAIRQNLEFIADNQVVLSGFNKRNYQHHL
ncbi:M56 family metallopeptidase, partial [Acinetobacter baumannii]